MLRALLGRRRGLVAGALLLVLVLAGFAVASRGGGADVVVYNGRSQYGDERAFTSFEQQTDRTLQLRGGTAPELFERLRSEGDQTPADLLVTTDLANLWRAKEAGLLESVSSPGLEENVPSAFRDPDSEWWGLSLRIRTPMRSTERVPERAVTSYEDLGDRRFRGRLCLRTSNNEYNQSLVADMLAKRGPEETTRILESWMANRPRILGSDVDVLDAIATGRCDVGLTNHYYLARMLAEDPDVPVAPAWPDQDGAGAHTNLSGVGLVKGSEHREAATELMEHLTSPEAQREVVANGELAVNRQVPPAEHIREWADVKKDPIDVARAGRLLPDAVALMQRVGWQ
ncbi:MAG: Ferric iron ABC transporter, iron-binding protein [uncultured Solirubrobacteraceae bacterium]|uniref:Ferric iron ABC transporter, iron-binding protein n=1 Tax=uncultured Solirubrobacteraceae bacterium TaxID=1162706 RepID=A0A6J4S767_9ACTN|nr:MAG: Ferric iron ABC transporter, iron-binding protein [uncultured Solirubrobacteraceae bacterium]